MTLNNNFIKQRLSMLLTALHPLKQGSHGLSSALTGAEREFFITHILSNVIAPPFRIGTGDITDMNGNKSGQCDLVIEYSNSISLPMLLGTATRLYLAEGVCAVIEIKSDMAGQQKDLAEHSNKIAALTKEYSGGMSFGGKLATKIPYFIVSYDGPKGDDTLKDWFNKIGNAAGILTLNPTLFIEKATDTVYKDADALFEFLIRIHRLTNSMVASVPAYYKY